MDQHSIEPMEPRPRVTLHQSRCQAQRSDVSRCLNIVGERHPRFPHERHHVPDLRAVAAVLQEPVGRFRLAEHTNMWSHSWRQFEPPLT
ncbi:hypothetical protein INR49_010767 [Caranx melampygus]|nr:hypothetical protein INR49_010767 [Caranx melampygus]